MRPKGVDRHDHEIGKRVAKFLIVEAEFFQIAKRRRFDQQLRRMQQRGKGLDIRSLFQIEDNAPLVGVSVGKRQTAFGMLDIPRKGWQPSIGIAARRFDFNHIGAKIGELPRRVGCRNIAKLDDTEMAQSAVSCCYLFLPRVHHFVNSKMLCHHEGREVTK